MVDQHPMQDPEQEKLESVATIVFFILLLASLFAVGYLFFSFLTDFILALLFLSIFNPSYRWLLPRVKNRRWLASLLVSILVVHVVAIPTTFLVGSLSAEAASAYQISRDSLSLEQVEQFLFGDGWFASTAKRATHMAGVEYTAASVKTQLANIAGPVTSFLNDQIQNIIGNVFSVIYHFIIMILILFYLFIDGERLKSFVFLLSPLPEEEEELITTKFKNVGRATLFGNGVGSLIQGVLGGVAMGLAGLPSPVLWGSVMTIFAFLPLVGISIVVIPAAIYLIAVGKIITAIIFVAFCTGMGLFVENVVKTKLIGDQMRMHNLLIFMSILGGLSVFGIIGILYGPLVVTLFLTFVELYQRHYKIRLSEMLAPKKTG